MEEIIRMEGITKVYPNGVVANNQVDFSITEGEIHALVGENGAGKSTLMKVLFGQEQSEEGKIFIRGREVKLTSSQNAIEHGIGMVHQHFMLVPSLTVAENLVLGKEPTKGGFLDFDKAVEITKELSEQYNLIVEPEAKVEDIPVGKKQKVEILKALCRGAKILILDEPTAVLTPQETSELFRELIELKNKGHTIIFISHKLNEVKEICDRVTIMRRGKNVGVFHIDEISTEEISNLMMGKEMSLDIQKKKAEPKEPVLSVDGLSYFNVVGRQVLKDVSFCVRAGEILGVAGVEGNGQKELVEIITGLQVDYRGTINILDRNIDKLSIKGIRGLGVGHIPEDRMTYGVAELASVEENLISNRYDDSNFQNKLLMDTDTIDSWTAKTIDEYIIKTDSSKRLVKMLSGGNIQKVVVARELSTDPKLLIAHQPTRGIDVGAANFIHRKLVDMRDTGAAILLVSADLNEIMDLSDSLIVMYEGEIVAYFEDMSKVTEEEIGLYMLGLKRQSEDEIGRCFHA